MRENSKRGGVVRLGAVAIIAAFAGAASARAAVPIAVTENGIAYGTTAGGEDRFLGLRYALPPTGARRWTPPQRVAPGFGLINATAFGPHCPQAASPFGVASTTEDCLFLNVYTPPREVAFAGGRPRPVMVWIHGGAFVTGESDDYDPVRLVRQGGVIVVTINYRLGALGILAQGALDAEGHPDANYSILDQQAALAWVRRNIAGFGGDPGNVTVFGQSAGGLAVLSNLVSPGAHGLLHAAIVESGAYSLRLPTLAAAETEGATLTAAVGCANQSAACLRAVPVATLLAHEQAGFGTVPVVDGTVLPLSIDAALAAGRFNQVPVMQGSNHDEGRLFTAQEFDLTAAGPLAAAAYPDAVAATYGAAAAPAILAQYPLADYGSAPNAADLADAAILTDSAFACPTRAADAALSLAVPTYAYEFNDEAAPEDDLPPVSFPYGATHASELQFLFDLRLNPLLHVPSLSPAEQVLAAAMVQYWTTFARTHTPEQAGLPAWPRYEVAGDRFQSLATGAGAIAPETSFAAEHDCAFWIAAAAE